MRLSPGSQKLIEEFFREHLDDAGFELPAVRFAAGRVAGILGRLFRIDGITVGPFVLVSPELLGFNVRGRKTLPEDLLVHEIAHVLQYRRDGFFRFLFRYFGDYRANLRKYGGRGEEARHLAYRDIPYEIEARDVAGAYLRWRGDRRVRQEGGRPD